MNSWEMNINQTNLPGHLKNTSAQDAIKRLKNWNLFLFSTILKLLPGYLAKYNVSCKSMLFVLFRIHVFIISLTALKNKIYTFLSL